MKMNKTVLAAAAIVLPLSVGFGSALSYFTANDSAVGGYEVQVGKPDTGITEVLGGGKKEITISNTGDVPVYVRARVYYDNNICKVKPDLINGWTNVDWSGNKDSVYYYYKPVLQPKDTLGGEDGKQRLDVTSTLTLNIDFPEKAVENDELDVVVYYEKTTAVNVVDGENGEKVVVPDWTFALEFEDKSQPKRGGDNQ